MQPTYLPWIGYFELIDSVDVFAILNSVQLSKQSWQTRNRIKNSNGQELLLSIPIRKSKSHKEMLIREAEVNDDMNWRNKHLSSFKMLYSKSSFFSEAFSIFEKALAPENKLLHKINESIIKQCVEALEIQTKIIQAPDIDIEDKQQRIIEICKIVGANSYISPRGSADYIVEEDFIKSGISLTYQNYEHPVYPQNYGEFLPFMGILDLIANVGAAKALEVIRSGKR